MRRNAIATGVLAEACAARGVDLLVVSTNEVFDGTRLDGHGYAPDDPVSPGNPYGASKAAAERLATEAFAAPCRGDPRDRPDGLAVRCARQRLPEPDPRRRRARRGSR